MTAGNLEIRGLSPEAAAHLLRAVQLWRKVQSGQVSLSNRRNPTPPNLLPADFGAIEFLLVSSGVNRGQPGPLLEHAHESRDANHAIAARVLTLDDVAAQLQCSVRTVKRRIAAGDLAAIKEGGFTRVRPADLDAYLDAKGA